MNFLIDFNIEERILDEKLNRVNLYIESQNKDDEEEKIKTSTIKEKLERLIEVLKNVYNKIIDSIKGFIDDILIKMDSRIKQTALQKKLEELKEMLAKNRAYAMNGKVEAIDVEKYIKFYSDFIDKYTEDVVSGLNKDFKSYEEFERWQNTMSDRLSEFDFKLDDADVYRITVSVNSLIDLNEKEIKNREKIIRMIEDKLKESSNKIKENMSSSRYDITKVMDDYKKEYPKLLDMKYAYAGNQLTAVVQVSKKVMKESAFFIFKNIGPLSIVSKLAMDMMN